MITVTVPASDVQTLVDQAAAQFPQLKGIKLSSESADFTVQTPQLGNVVVRVQVVSDAGGT